MLQSHHIISKAIATGPNAHPLLTALAAAGAFNVNASANLVDLPATRALAQSRGASTPAGSISPHNGGPLASYESGVRSFLNRLANNNPGASPQDLATKIADFQNEVRNALTNGELF